MHEDRAVPGTLAQDLAQREHAVAGELALEDAHPQVRGQTLLRLAEPQVPPDVPTTTVQRGRLDLVMIESGDVEAVRSVEIRAPLEWRDDLQVIELATEGVVVDSGAFVCQIDTGFLQEELGASRSQLEIDRASRAAMVEQQRVGRGELELDLEGARLSHELATLQLEQLRFESDTRREEAALTLRQSEIALQEARTKLETQAMLDSLELAEIELEIAKGEVRVAGAEAQIDRMRLFAPQRGLLVFTEREDDGRIEKVREGDRVYPGSTIAQIPDLTAMMVRFAVNEVDRHRITVGMPVRVSLEAYPDEVFTAAITSIARLATVRRGHDAVKVFMAEAHVEGTSDALKPGMTAVVEVALGGVNDALLVPLAAVFERDGALVVYPRVDWPEPRRIRLGRTTPLRAEVIEGLEPGTEVALRRPDAQERADG